MISSVTGRLIRVNDTTIDLTTGPFGLTVLVPVAEVEGLRAQLQSELTLYTLLYLEGDATRGNLEPRLVGFVREEDRAFFELFTTVKGIGPRTALKALSEPVGTIAAWIESRDARSLTRLSGVGKRTAELIVAELSGKCGRFAGGPHDRPTASRKVPANRSREEQDAVAALIALGERPADAEQLLDRARRANPDAATTDQLIREMLRAK